MEDPYFIRRWSEGYFAIEQGNVVVKPNRQKESGNLYQLVRSLVEKGIEPPILVRFNGIIKDRLQTLNAAFLSAIDEFRYRNGHLMAFPVKVNPHASVVEAIEKHGKAFSIGLEVGSKPELMAVLPSDFEPNSLILCNGYKDAEYISLALIAKQLGKRPIIIVEQIYEMKLVLEIAAKVGLEVDIGLRMKLSTQGMGRWQSSSGDLAKFGLTSYELVECLQTLKKEGKEHFLKLLHFHMGSQQTTIEPIKASLNEASRIYTEIAKEFPSLTYFDVGGGLAVDYDGTKSDTNSSMNYSLEEYARNVVSFIGEACLQNDLKDPILITESGRALLAHASVLIVEVIDVTTKKIEEMPSSPFSEMQQNLTKDNCREIFHDAVELKKQIVTEFNHGQISLQERALAEKAYQALFPKILELLEGKEEMELVDTYFCNFSVFQSIPDSWAIDQLFPILPIHRLEEKPTHNAILADLTCDSDGKVDLFLGGKFLKLHSYNGNPYYLGIFLVGAYQEILGGLHNLFGNTNVVHADLGDKGWEFSKLVEGDTIEEVLQYGQYSVHKLQEQLHTLIEQSIVAGRITALESAQIKKKFKQALESYTYLII